MTIAKSASTALPQTNITFAPFTQDHLADGLRMSQAVQWPHRAEDWALTLSVSEGVVAIADGQVVGTALCSGFGAVATMNMIIVDAAMRGRGLGRALMEQVIALGGTRELRRCLRPSPPGARFWCTKTVLPWSAALDAARLLAPSLPKTPPPRGR